MNFVFFSSAPTLLDWLPGTYRKSAYLDGYPKSADSTVVVCGVFRATMPQSRACKKKNKKGWWTKRLSVLPDFDLLIMNLFLFSSQWRQRKRRLRSRKTFFSWTKKIANQTSENGSLSCQIVCRTKTHDRALFSDGSLKAIRDPVERNHHPALANRPTVRTVNGFEGRGSTKGG